MAHATQFAAANNVRAVGYDQVDNLLILAGQTDLYTSADGGVSGLGTPRGIPLSGQTNPGNVVGRVVRFKALWVCLITDQTGGYAAIYTSPAPGPSGTCTWTLRQNLTAGSDGLFFPCLDQDGTAVVVGEYGDPLVGGTKTPHIWRSTDGITWSVAWQTTGSGAQGAPTNYRHVHAVAPDPYEPGVWYSTFGDGPSPCMLKSTDYGATWATVSTLTADYQSVQISFDPNYVWLAADTTKSAVWLMDRRSNALKSGAVNDHSRIAVPNPGLHPAGSWTLNGTTVTDFVNHPFHANSTNARITGNGIPAGATITAANDTSATISAAITQSATNQPYQIHWSEAFWADNFYGAVDPATGAYYFTTPGNGENVNNGRRGLFYVPYPGGSVELLDVVPRNTNNLFIAGGYVFAGPVRRPLISFAS